MVDYNNPVHSKFLHGKLYKRMEDDLHLAGMGQRIVHGYLRSVRQLADFCERSPDKVTEDQLRRFFLHLKNERHFAYGSLRVAYTGIKFFYTRTCKRKWKTLAKMKLQNVKTLQDDNHVSTEKQELQKHRSPRCSLDVRAEQQNHRYEPTTSRQSLRPFTQHSRTNALDEALRTSIRLPTLICTSTGSRLVRTVSHMDSGLPLPRAS